MTPLLRQAYAEAAIRSRRLGRVEVPGRVPGDNFNNASLIPKEKARKMISAAETLRTQINAQLQVRPMLLAELAEACGVDMKRVQNAVAVMRERGHVRFKPETKSTPTGGVTCNRYTLTPEGRAFNGEAKKSAPQGVDAVLQVMTAPDKTNAVAPVSAGFRADVFVRTIQAVGKPDREVRISLAPNRAQGGGGMNAPLIVFSGGIPGHEAAEEMADRIKDVIYDYAGKVPLALAIGVLEIVKMEVMGEAE